MSAEKGLISRVNLQDIADAIREKNGGNSTYRPEDMATAIQELDTSGIHPTGTKQIMQNGTTDVTEYASANVNVQPNLQSKTATENGTVTPDQGYDGLSSVVVSVSGGGSNDLVADWDFTQSLTDSVSSMVAALNGGCTQDSGGLHFTASKQYVTLNGSNTVTFFPDRTFELDISSMNLQGNDTSHYTLLTHDLPTISGAYGFLYRNTGYWALYDGNWQMSTISGKNYWSGKTIGLYLSTEGTMKIYENGVLAATLPYSGTARRTIIGNGREQSSGGQIYNTTITGCRIYRGNHYE